MQDEVIPHDVLRFLLERIDSVPHLEALLLLWENPGQLWSEPEIAARVYVSEDVARRVLLDLAQRKLIASDASAGLRYVYDPAWDEAAQMMPRLAAAYRRHLIRVA